MTNSSDTAKHKRFRTIFLIFIASFCFPLVIGSVLLYKAAIFVNSAVGTEGTVVSVSTQRSSDIRSSPKYFPTIEFTDTNGQVHKLVVSQGSIKYDYKEGETVEILFDQENPSELQIAGFESIWILGIIFFGLGLSGTIVGTVCYRVIKKKQKELDSYGNRGHATLLNK